MTVKYHTLTSIKIRVGGVRGGRLEQIRSRSEEMLLLSIAVWQFGIGVKPTGNYQTSRIKTESAVLINISLMAWNTEREKMFFPPISSNCRTERRWRGHILKQKV